jgi:hypothetical protein
MRVSKPFLQLPIRFCAETLAREVHALPPEAWTPHPQGYRGNEAVALVSPDGGINDDMAGEMAATEYLRACPYVMDVMAELDGVWGRSRLMGLGAGAEVPIHVDVHYYWRTHLRLHIPVVTNPGVRFTCGDETVHMAPGECWAFDSFRRHRVENSGAEKRVHLVLDTVGNERLWDMLAQAELGVKPSDTPLKPVPESEKRDLAFERVNVPLVMSAWEMQCHLEYLIQHAVDHDSLDPVVKRLRKFLAGWQAMWSRFGAAEDGLPSYRSLLDEVRPDLHTLGGAEIELDNGELFLVGVEALIFWNAIARDRSRAGIRASNMVPIEPLAPELPATPSNGCRQRIERPIFIVSSPRSGSTLLFDTLAEATELFSVGGESHGVIESVRGLSVREKGWTSNRLTAQDAFPEAVEQLAEGFYRSLRDRDGTAPSGPARMLEKTPKNALRVPFFDAAWPDSEFVFLYRDPRQTLSSMMEAWLSGGFRTYPVLPGWKGPPWSMLLVPGWEQLVGMSLPEIVAHQWSIALDVLVSDLHRVPRERVRGVEYDDFLDSPQATIERLAKSLDLKWDRQLGPELPISITTVSRPSRDKWKEVAEVVESVWPIVEKTDAKAREFLATVRV